MERKMAKIWVVLGTAAIVVLGVMAVKAAEGDAIKPIDLVKQGEMMIKSGKECTMKDMRECVTKCTMSCEKNMKSVSEAIASLDEAAKAVDAGNMADAKMKIERAKMMLKDVQDCQKKCMEQMPTYNDSCPISGMKIDRMKTPENQMRMYKGRKIGFCSPACPVAWDKLTDAEKEAKLEKAMPAIPEKEELLKDIPEDMKMQKKAGEPM